MRAVLHGSIHASQRRPAPVGSSAGNGAFTAGREQAGKSVPVAGLTVTMLVLQAVVFVEPADAMAASWPTATVPASRWLVLDGGCTEGQIGLFVAGLARALDPGTLRLDNVVEALLAEESLIAAGGLRAHDPTSGVEVVPGCCCGLEAWRDWLQVLAGNPPWLGHDPTPTIEIVGEHVTVRQDSSSGASRRPAQAQLTIGLSTLPVVLASAQRDLVAFLAAFRNWTATMGLGHRGLALADAINHHFCITAPLGRPTPWS